ncbi:MAG: DegT/DnrJ/EryC1/StrS family aminotransferase [Phycisphaerae bacterium]|nr:DegT/DnrJ/EryC1/StrS family aminotransferase [Phycisphaerae bacterium]
MSTVNEIPLSRPDVTQLEIDAVSAVLRSGRLSIGPVQEQFEAQVGAACDRHYAIACSSGTVGLHMALLALGIGPGDEVITTPFSFIASSNVILYVGAKPVFVDICPKSLNMDPARVEAAITPRTKAILAVETFGNPEHMDAYASIAARHEIPLIEDCCEALGCSHKGRPCGSFGRVGVFGFYPNKQITTGEGGMIVTDDKRLADLCRSLRSQGRPVPAMPTGMGSASASAAVGMGGAGVAANGAGGAGTGSWLVQERLGYNYRLSEVHAALGVVQMKRLPELIAKRQKVARAYMERLMTHGEIVLPTISPQSVMSWFVFVVRLASSYTREERDRVIAGMRRHEVGAGDYFPCIHLQPFYRERFGYGPGDYPIAESVSQRTIALPFYNDLRERDIDMVCQTLDLMIRRENLKRG